MTGRVRVTYKRLEKGTKVVFQPRKKEFQVTLNTNPDIDIKACLEECLSAYSCLAVGDWVTLVIPGGDAGAVEFELRVKELEVDHQPAGACSIIDTDLEAEVHPSVETEERIFQEELRAKQLMEEREREKREKEEEDEQARRALEENEASRKALRAQRAARLPEEPTGAGVSSVMFRFPNGEKHRRSFLPEDPVGLLFCFVDSQGASGLMPGDYNLVSQFPRFEIAYCELEESSQALGELECFQGGPSSLTLFVETKARR